MTIDAYTTGVTHRVISSPLVALNHCMEVNGYMIVGYDVSIALLCHFKAWDEALNELRKKIHHKIDSHQYGNNP